MEKHKRETKSKKHNDHYGLSLTIDNSRTGKKSRFAIRITNPTLRMILYEEERQLTNKMNQTIHGAFDAKDRG